MTNRVKDGEKDSMQKQPNLEDYGEECASLRLLHDLLPLSTDLSRFPQSSMLLVRWKLI
jgi:hypothetical protein